MLYLGKIIFGDDITVTKVTKYILPLKIRLQEKILFNLKVSIDKIKLKIQNQTKIKLKNSSLKNLKLRVKDLSKISMKLDSIKD